MSISRSTSLLLATSECPPNLTKPSTFRRYLSVYYLHYTRASSADVGRVMLASSFFGILLSLSLCSIADRYQAHRRVYLLSLGLAYLSFLVLLAPFVTPSGLFGAQSDLWFYLAGVCVALGSMATTVNFSLSDCFSINVSRKCNQVTFGEVRIFAPLGFIFASLVLIGLDKLLDTSTAYLSPALSLFVLFATLNVLLVGLWPDGRPFDLSDQVVIDDKQLARPQPDQIKFESRGRFQLLKKTCGWNNLEEPTSCKLKAVDRLFSFDARDEDKFRNVRRCSLAPLGDSYCIKQFELEPPSLGGHKVPVAKNHFGFVTVIEPSDYFEDNLKAAVWTVEREKQPETETTRTTTVISFRCHLKAIELLARRDKDMVRFMLLYAVIGFTVAMNWVYLLPYLESIDADKFKVLAPWTLIAGYLSETLFYQFGSRLIDLTNHKRHSFWLTFVLLALALRYSLYLVLVYWSPGAPMECIILFELLQSVSLGIFNCLINEAALKFALGVQGCLAELKEAQLISSQVRATELSDKFKLTVLSLSSCCFDGIGVAFGSLAGGWLIEHYGYLIMWQTSITVALFAAICNCLLEFRLMSSSSSSSSSVAPLVLGPQKTQEVAMKCPG